MPNQQAITIIGIDPGYDRLGWAIGKISASAKQASAINQKPSYKKLNIIDYGCIQTNKKDQLFTRYQQLQTQLATIINKYQPQIAVIESLFFFKNKKTALQVSEARGVVIAYFLSQNLNIFEYTPLQIKQSVTGYGKADKLAVDKMLRMQLELINKPILDDAMDAIGVVFTYFTNERNKVALSSNSKIL